jgi:hypothetical protein
VLGKQLKKKLETVQLPNNTVKCHIQDLSADTDKQLGLQLKPSFAFSYQHDESTDLSRLAVVLVFVCFIPEQNRRRFTV